MRYGREIEERREREREKRKTKKERRWGGGFRFLVFFFMEGVTIIPNKKKIVLKK